MVAYNFQSQFAPLVESGEKRQTFRVLGKRRHARPGDSLQLYTGMRTKACRKLVTPDPVCLFSSPVFIVPFGTKSPVMLEGDADYPHPDRFARDDGFIDFDDLLCWLAQTHGLPFDGQLIKW